MQFQFNLNISALEQKSTKLCHGINIQTRPTESDKDQKQT